MTTKELLIHIKDNGLLETVETIDMHAIDDTGLVRIWLDLSIAVNKLKHHILREQL